MSGVPYPRQDRAEKCPIPDFFEQIAVRRDTAVGRDVLFGGGVLKNERFEVDCGKHVDHNIARGSRRVGIRAEIVVLLDTDKVSGSPDVSQFSSASGLIPQCHSTLLNHEDL